MSNSSRWWGPARVPLGEVRRWRIGPLSLAVERTVGEWQIVCERGSDPLEDGLTGPEDLPTDGTLIEHPDVTRFGVSGDDDTIHLHPCAADRSVVTRPLNPYAVPPGERVTVWVGTPLWLRIQSGAKRLLLSDTPIYPPSNTWFGASPAEGELCYATRSVFRSRLEDVLFRPHRAVTTLHIRNRGEAPLQLERVNVPVPYLPLYTAPDTGALWTPEVTLSHADDEELSPVQISIDAPETAPDATRVAEPRRETNNNMLVRAFSSLFSS